MIILLPNREYIVKKVPGHTPWLSLLTKIVKSQGLFLYYSIKCLNRDTTLQLLNTKGNILTV